MNYTPILLALCLMAVVFGSMGMLTKRGGFQSIPEFFFASRTIRAPLIISLLVSGSFSLNGMLYQIYLGYKIGAWALLTQFAWAASFFFLAKYTPRLAASAGLHNFLGTTFSPLTRKLAALCSIIGLALQTGWEFGVAKSAFAGLATPPLPDISVEIMVFAVFAIGTFYTLVGGMRSNSWTDFFENALKIGCFVVLGFLLFGISGSPLFSANWFAIAVPPFSQAVAELTVIGFITNLGFSLAWQFVDMTTWQTTVATRVNHNIGVMRRSLKWAGFWVFVTPGILGTVIGLGLFGQQHLDSNSVLPALLKLVGGGPIIIFVLTIALAATVMSFIDGMLLGIGFTFITDLLFAKKVDEHQLLKVPDEGTLNDPRYQRLVGSIMGWARVALVLTAILVTYGLTWFADRMHVGLFDLVYLVVVGQLALFGPSLVALMGRQANKFVGPPAILIPLLLGYGLAIYGTVYAIPDLVNGASMVTLLLSFGIAYFGSRRPTSNKV